MSQGPVTYTDDDTSDIYWGEHPHFTAEAVHSEVTDTRRWGHDEERVYRHNETGEHWSVSMYIMSEASTGDHEANGAPVKVVAVEKMVTVWETVKSPKVDQ